MKRVWIICVMAVLTLLLGGCTINQPAEADDHLNIVTSFYPIYIATSNIIDGAENVSLQCLASPDVGCLHDYQLTVKDMITLETADIFVINGGGAESFLDKAVSAYPDLIVINASDEILEEFIHREEEEGLLEEHSHEDEENSHIWVSVSLYIEEVKNISKKLIEYNPENADLYASNTEAYISRLESLGNEMHQGLTSISKRNIVTFHEAFDYFAEEYDLNIVAVVEREPGTSPSASELAEIIDLVRANDVSAIFTEPQYSKSAAITIANETGVPVYELDPVVTGAFEKDAYEKAMRNNLDVLLEALGE
ncbi:MAG: zinc ABC transporter substrate-binding protein [Clostridia bacterium]|nr:zinc ABC transporter substrate-binding protein [Clostridia bacterium]